jgi:hypothetical protein
MKYRIMLRNAEGELHDIIGDLSLPAVLREARAWFENRPTPWNNGALAAFIGEQDPGR